MISRGGILSNNALDPLLVLDSVALKQVVGVCLRGRLGVWVVEEVLDTQKNCLDGDGGLPGLFLVQNGEANSAGRVDIRVEQGRDELALRWLGRIFWI